MIFAFYGKFPIRMRMSPYSTNDVRMDFFLGFVSEMESLTKSDMGVFMPTESAYYVYSSMPTEGECFSDQIHTHIIYTNIYTSSVQKSFFLIIAHDVINNDSLKKEINLSQKILKKLNNLLISTQFFIL